MSTYAVPPSGPLLHWRKTSPLSAQARRILTALEFRAGDETQLAAAAGLSEQKTVRTLHSLERRGLARSSSAGWSISDSGLAAL